MFAVPPAKSRLLPQLSYLRVRMYLGCVVLSSCVKSSSMPRSMPSLPVLSLGIEGSGRSQPNSPWPEYCTWMCAVTTPLSSMKRMRSPAWITGTAGGGAKQPQARASAE